LGIGGKTILEIKNINGVRSELEAHSVKISKKNFAEETVNDRKGVISERKLFSSDLNV
jgi:hypothetical protein